MRTFLDLELDNTYARLGPAFSESVAPTAILNPRLIAFNPDAARLIDLDPAFATDPDAALYLSGGRLAPGAEPIAAIYAGHQFGVWVPQLGDGRAILLGEARSARGERWDLQLKGAGMTRFSRMGDGRAVLRSTIREYLASEAMHGLGIPTTRALSIVAGDDPVYRETVETSAVLIRMAPTHVRFGTFQVFASRGQTDEVRTLADYVIDHHDPDLRGEPDRYRIWLERTVDRTAELIARWMAVGFAHGVMNTDNMSVIGLTLDYGPYGFLDEYQLDFICNHSDQEGRYAFDRQPAVGLWNLARFAEALLSLVSVEEANAALTRYAGRFETCYTRLMRRKLGLVTEGPEDAELIGELLGLLAAHRVDYTRWFRVLPAVSAGAFAAPESLRSFGVDLERLDAWVERYGRRLAAEGSVDVERRDAMKATNPKYVLRNYLAQLAIEKAQAGDHGIIDEMRKVLARPFDEHPEYEAWAEAPPIWAKELSVSCSS